ncbi:hypothetical protein M3P05_05455 [Sansalvadorimonas sp. 2012CJ34-2]|uniref:Uncharacterized protein n=1 Tax=Parendozoicomonas callyspongiae TaxID=2942213 RepID=A0ABT0PF43_9GAMM|nr:hypothetical protein [Sansalvadorimonas sp. 2012CJ34-2]MCL6269392.1 hypothetical protein [Sansalvadorimonas sp. 2012CJ34-2]
MDLPYFQRFQTWLNKSLQDTGEKLAIGESENGEFRFHTPTQAFGHNIERLRGHLRTFIQTLPHVSGSRLASHSINPASVDDMQTLVRDIEDDPAYIVACLDQDLKSVDPLILQNQHDPAALEAIKAQVEEFTRPCIEAGKRTFAVIHLQALLSRINKLGSEFQDSATFMQAAEMIAEQIHSAAQPKEDIDYTALRSFSTGGVPPFFMELQPDPDSTGCGTYAANAFFGGSALNHPANSDPIADADLLKRMRTACHHAPIDQPMPKPGDIELYHDHYSDKLLSQLNEIKADRFILMSGLNSHYVTFRRDRTGQWYRIDSRQYRDQEPIDPASYLNRLYQGQNMDFLSETDRHISIISLKGENLSVAILTQ